MIEEKLIALIDILIEEKFNDIPTVQGKRGLRGLKGVAGKDGQHGKDGKDGESFSWDKFKDQILIEIQNNAIKGEKGDPGLRGPRGLKGKDGVDGKDGIDGKSFEWDDYKDLIISQIEKHKLTFDDLSEDQKESLRGDRGPRGQRGKPGEKGDKGDSFIWDEHKDKILDKIEASKLTFSDFTDEEKEQLKGAKGDRGPRGQRGKAGANGLSAYELWSEENKGSKEDFLKSLRGKDGIPGIPGLNGLNGLDGIDGNDGKDASEIVDIRLFESNNKFYFKFYFDDNLVIETNKVELPVVKKLLKISESTFQRKLIVYQSTKISYDSFNRANNIKNYLNKENKYLHAVEEIVYDDNSFVDYILEKIYSAEGDDESSPNRLIATNKIDIIYDANNFVTDIRVDTL